MLSPQYIYLVGREKVRSIHLLFYVGGIVELFVILLLKIKKGPMKGQLLEVIKRKIPIDRLAACSLRYDTSGELSAIIVTAALCSFVSLLWICRY